jgi:ubiquinol-cytochrome c reductase iron-sulfur subunit
VRWRDRLIFVINRTPQILQTLQDQKLVSQLADLQSSDKSRLMRTIAAAPSSRNTGFSSAYAPISAGPPKFEPLPNGREPVPNWLGGYFCPCHGSKYDSRRSSILAGCRPLTICPFRHITS